MGPRLRGRDELGAVTPAHAGVLPSLASDRSGEMYVELIDALRCPRPHPEGTTDTWLVAAARRSSGRCIVDGVLGCPVCRAEFPIAGGVADFGAPRDIDPPAAAAPAPDATADALRLAALLDLASPGGIVAVGGDWDAALDGLADLTDVRALVVEPAHAYAPREPFGALVGGELPVAAGALRGVALDARTATPARLTAAVRALRPAGRLVAPAGVPAPDGMRELARDAAHWVAERAPGRDAAPAGLVPLRRR
ncbi:hypothetical protein tb265_02920 [Gemmatimonadetes bacterium T265]|nr:hypothetical protein tb265_02920 [Gemmatimonadetes bacterium T265]